MENIDDRNYTIGVLVLSNFGQMKDLMIDEVSVEKQLAEGLEEKNQEDKCSIILVVAMDIPLSSRQL